MPSAQVLVALKNLLKPALVIKSIHNTRFIRMSSSTLLKDKAYVNGQWVSAKSGATFKGKETDNLQFAY